MSGLEKVMWTYTVMRHAFALSHVDCEQTVIIMEREQHGI